MDSEAYKEYSMISNILEEIGFWSYDSEVLDKISHEIWAERYERDLRITRQENTGSQIVDLDLKQE